MTRKKRYQPKKVNYPSLPESTPVVNKQFAKITQRHLELAEANAPQTDYARFQRYEPLPGVIPAGKVESTLAMDATPYDVLNTMNLSAEYAGFRGYPILATMAQQVEYNNMVQVLADEMVRNWIEVKSLKAGDEFVDTMEDLLTKYDIKRLIHEAVVQDATFGIAHIFVDTDASETELANPLVLDPRSFKKDKFKGFRIADPTWIYPATYNTQYPLRADFYKPQQWFVMGQTVHESRLIDMVSRPVMQILKPSYNFGGLSLIQLMEDYVNDWRDVKRNVAAIIRTLRMRALATDMDARLQEPGQFDARMKFMSLTADNFGFWAYDKMSEELVHHQTSLSDLSNLLSNYQDQLCIPARITNLKLLGNAPAGLNASGDSELETWHETISGMQERDIRRALETIFKIIQMVEFGEIKLDLYFEFRPLDELSDLDKATINKLKVETVTTAADSMLISSEEGRDALKEIEGGGFDNLVSGYEPEEGQDTLAQDSSLNNGYASVKPFRVVADAISNHLESIGISGAIRPEDMHVTLMYSKDSPIGAEEYPETIYEADVLRDFEIMGNDPWRALVVHLDSDQLSMRHDELVQSGASHSYPSYKAHMSLKYDPSEDDLDKIKRNPLPFTVIHLSGEKFKPIKA